MRSTQAWPLNLDAMTLLLAGMPLLWGTLLKTRYSKDVILILWQWCLAKAELTAVVLIIWCHGKHEPHVFLKELLQTSYFLEGVPANTIFSKKHSCKHQLHLHVAFTESTVMIAWSQALLCRRLVQGTALSATDVLITYMAKGMTPIMSNFRKCKVQIAH